MRLAVTLEAPGELNLPQHYGAALQGFIYQQLEPNLAAWLHGEAYSYAKRTYKMFTFSRLTGAYRLDKKNKRIAFSGPVTFQLASHNAEVLASLAEHLLKSQRLRLGQNEVQVRGVEILTKPELEFGKPVNVRALSPITTRSTFEKPGGGKVTHYYSPHEKDWSEMLVKNLSRKAAALEWGPNAAALQNATVRPLKVNERDKKVVKYKGFVIEAWLGVYELSLPQAYFALAYDVGLGEKNAQGFGMVEVV